MSEVKWISVNDRLPEFPKDGEELVEYLVTIGGTYGLDNLVTSLFFLGDGADGHWEDLVGDYIDDVIAWAEMPEPFKDPSKYRWRLNPSGYGVLRAVYLTAAGPALTIAEWDAPIENDGYKNVFTEKEYAYLAKFWKFDLDLFVREPIDGSDTEVKIEWK